MLLKFGIKRYRDDSVIMTGEKLELWEGCFIFLCLIKFMKVNMKFMKVKSWNCGEGMYFVGVIKFMDRLSAGV